VFLSHSSKDKSQLLALKELLDRRAVRSLEFFLSSDGQSVRFGRNWVVRISDALANAKLMFLFLSPQSADSKWIHFEAGCAYAQHIEVVPICLPGLELARVTAPLNLLQGFNLHSHEALGNIVRICNQSFDLKMEEAFSVGDFDNVFADSMLEQRGFFGEHTSAIESIIIRSAFALPATGTPDPSASFAQACKDANIETVSDSNTDGNGIVHTELQCCGCRLQVAVPTTDCGRIFCALSPELCHINAPILDKWLSTFPLQAKPGVEIIFRSGACVEEIAFKLTTKLYKSHIRMLQLEVLDFEGLAFRLDFQHQILSIVCESQAEVFDKRLPLLIAQLFEREVIWLGSDDESAPSK